MHSPNIVASPSVLAAQQLKEFVERYVRVFTEVQLLDKGEAFHYTPHAETISKSGRILGAPIDNNLAGTQRTSSSQPAKHDPGVIFAYPTIEKAVEQGLDFEILRIAYTKAISATHSLEAQYAKYGVQIAPTVLILTTDVISLVRLGPARRLHGTARSSFKLQG